MPDRIHIEPRVALPAPDVIAVAMVGAGIVASALLGSGGAPQSADLGVNVYPLDVIAVGLAAFGFVRLHRARMGPLVPMIIFLTLICLSFWRGSQLFGLKRAGNESRTFIYFGAAALYFSTCNLSARFLKGATIICGAGAICVVLVVLFRWAVLARGGGADAAWADPDKPTRVIGADAACFLADATLIFLFVWLRGRRGWLALALAAACAATAVMQEHRSVWAAGACGVAWLLRLTFATSRKAWMALAATTACLMALAVLFFAAQLAILSASLNEAIDETANRQSTWEWRVEGWTELLSGEKTEPLDWAVGKPLGTGFYRRVFGQVRDELPHNFYVQSVLRVGVVGLISLGATYAAAFVCLRRAGRWRWVNPLLEALLVVQLLYDVPYWPTMDQGTLLGLAIAAGAGRRADDTTQRRTAASVAPDEPRAPVMPVTADSACWGRRARRAGTVEPAQPRKARTWRGS